MFESFSRSWALTKASWRVLKLDKEILLLPIFSGIVLMAILAVATGGIFGLNLFDTLLGSPGLALLALFVFYVVSYFVVIFFNAAIIECAMIRFNGGDPVVRDGLRKAWSKMGRILQWAVVAATVGVILKLLENAARQSDNDIGRIVGQIAVAIAGAAWTIATYFVVPALIYQDVGPFQAIRSSLTTWKRTWGDGAGAVFTVSIIFFVLGLVGLLPMWLGVGLAQSGAVLGYVLVFATVAYWLALSTVSTALDGIVTAAVFKYAQDGRMPEAFTESIPSAKPLYA